MAIVLPVKVEGKKAIYTGREIYVCHNGDYVIQFSFSEEWKEHEAKTARFRNADTFIDVLFTGNQCPVPMFETAWSLCVGVFAGDLVTTTGASIPAENSIRSGEGSEIQPPESDVYDQLMVLVNQLPDALHAAENAGASETASAASEKNAALSETNAKKSEIIAAAAAETAEKSVANGAYISTYVGEDGYLYFEKTENAAELELSIADGELILEVKR